LAVDILGIDLIDSKPTSLCRTQDSDLARLAGPVRLKRKRRQRGLRLLEFLSGSGTQRRLINDVPINTFAAAIL
jgi:hypothetical protein